MSSVSVEYAKKYKIPLMLVVCAVWAITPILRRSMVERITETKQDKNSAVQVVLLILGVSYVLVLGSQFCMSNGPGSYATFLSHTALLRTDGLVLLSVSSSLTVLSNLVLTALLLQHNPGTIMAMLNGLTNFATYALGTVAFGSGVTCQGLLALLLIGAGIYLLNKEKETP
tara:strand:+ start:1161 stop:1673 length:513 start_codon:yes stop_codon:yes gene_type:complete